MLLIRDKLKQLVGVSVMDKRFMATIVGGSRFLVGSPISMLFIVQIPSFIWP